MGLISTEKRRVRGTTIVATSSHIANYRVIKSLRETSSHSTHIYFNTHTHGRVTQNWCNVTHVISKPLIYLDVQTKILTNKRGRKTSTDVSALRNGACLAIFTQHMNKDHLILYADCCVQESTRHHSGKHTTSTPEKDIHSLYLGAFLSSGDSIAISRICSRVYCGEYRRPYTATTVLAARHST